VRIKTLRASDVLTHVLRDEQITLFDEVEHRVFGPLRVSEPFVVRRSSYDGAGSRGPARQTRQRLHVEAHVIAPETDPLLVERKGIGERLRCRLLKGTCHDRGIKHLITAVAVHLAKIFREKRLPGLEDPCHVGDQARSIRAWSRYRRSCRH
jgi:hypothetical protein